MEKIHFFKEGIRFRLLHRKELTKWITTVVKHHKYEVDEISFIFCTDKYLLALNKKFLNHNYFTDIITFDNSGGGKKISGDVFISFERVEANADKYNTSVKDELHRVIIHGILHLAGHTDKTAREKMKMKEEEDKWLAERKF